MKYNLIEMMDLALAKALLGKLQPNEETFWREIAREYSKTFHTPLTEVNKLDPEFVMLSIQENRLEPKNISDEQELNKVLEELYTLDNPDYDAEAEKEEIEYNKKAEKEEKERQARIAAKKAGKKKPAEEPVKELPKAGGINLSYLSENEENEG